MIQQDLPVDESNSVPYFNQMQKEILEAFTLLENQQTETSISYTTTSTKLCTFLDSVLGQHSVMNGNQITVSNSRESPELLDSLQEAKDVATEQGKEVVENEEFTISQPAELTLFEQSILTAEIGYIKETDETKYIALDLQNTEIEPVEAIPFFYSFNPLLLNNQQVILCETEKFMNSVERNPLPTLSETLSLDVTPVSDLPFDETQTCAICDAEYAFINSHEAYSHNEVTQLSDTQREFIKGLLICDKAEFIATDDGWGLKSTGLQKEFAEWIDTILSFEHRTKISNTDENEFTILAYPSYTFTELVEWEKADRDINHSTSKELLSVLFALKGNVNQREVRFDLDVHPDICAELFELFESFRIEDGLCVVSLSELEVFIGDSLPGFEQKWKDNMVIGTDLNI